MYTGEIEFGQLFDLAKVCAEAAAAGDSVAGDAVGFLAEEVVAMVTATAGRLGVDHDEVEVVLGGGLFGGEYSAFTLAVETGVRAAVPLAVFRRLGGAPVLGAALLGLDAVGAPEVAVRRLRDGAMARGASTLD